ncbi:MAG: orotidine 5'-phosphate decarboxylase / HUMPS family protein [Candidatus Atabeyarchaeum deiterrae]
MHNSSKSFRQVLDESSASRATRIVLALDVSERLPQGRLDEVRNHLLEKALYILEATNEYVAALKINHQLLLPLGLYDLMQTIIKKAKSYSLPLIMDCKANDVEHTNRWIATHYFDAGFDAIIANPFVGWEGGIEPIMTLSREQGKGVILLTYMSHRGSIEGYGQQVLSEESAKPRPQYMVFAEKAARWKADGIVVGATYPEKIREIYRAIRDQVPIYSPGIGAQGGEIREAFDAGCKYAIIGRSIYESEDPSRAANEMRQKINGVLKGAL